MLRCTPKKSPQTKDLNDLKQTGIDPKADIWFLRRCERARLDCAHSYYGCVTAAVLSSLSWLGPGFYPAIFFAESA